MKPVVLKYFSIIFVVFGSIFSIVSVLPVRINPDPMIWFSPAYYTQFLPLFIACTLLLSGLFMLMRWPRTNIYLALFGHTAVEEIIFSWIGLTRTVLPMYAVGIYFPLSIAALWLAYTNAIKKKRLSMVEAVFGILVSITLVLAPRYL